MPDVPIRFNDGAAYEQLMGIWSRLAGEVFLDWLAPAKRLRWIDSGCGNGAFTDLLAERCAPAEVQGVDPSEGQLAYARTRRQWSGVEFRQGDAMALPFPEGRFDAGVMALVLVFLSDPAKGVAELIRVVVPGGMVATYMWDMEGGGFPLDPLLAEMRAMGMVSPLPTSMGASGMDAMKALWSGAGAVSLATREIIVQRTFASFEEYWTIGRKSSTIGPALRSLATSEVETLKERVRVRMQADEQPLTFSARANAIKGLKPG